MFPSEIFCTESKFLLSHFLILGLYHNISLLSIFYLEKYSMHQFNTYFYYSPSLSCSLHIITYFITNSCSLHIITHFITNNYTYVPLSFQILQIYTLVLIYLFLQMINLHFLNLLFLIISNFLYSIFYLNRSSIFLLLYNNYAP